MQSSHCLIIKGDQDSSLPQEMLIHTCIWCCAIEKAISNQLFSFRTNQDHFLEHMLKEILKELKYIQGHFA